jgi:hypothetical protein
VSRARRRRGRARKRSRYSVQHPIDRPALPSAVLHFAPSGQNTYTALGTITPQRMREILDHVEPVGQK